MACVADLTSFVTQWSVVQLSLPSTMYAFVKYKDNHRAIMPVSLIENLAPTSTEDIPQRTVRAYWRSSDGEDEGHYDANVVLLGGKSSNYLYVFLLQHLILIVKATQAIA